MLTKSEKAEIIKSFCADPKNTGSSVAQVGLISSRIKSLSGHMKTHKTDYSSGRGLLKLVGKRRAFLKYLKRSDPNAARKLVSDLDLG
ncbi:MAG: 30S ribosomal protein S15 [Elusimicrobiota bacterium]